ncbi:MAG: YbaB/EbfC family nucleoid-associated protein [Firmicutes bacterium]|nr:YbaB/EbfC family nucleoid-associated protein [Bacillota bacterium]
MGKGMRAGKAKKPQKAGGFNMQQLQQMQALQAQMEKAQADLEEKEITTTAGGGVVEVTVNGKKELTKLVIKPEVVDPDDVETLEDLVMAAVNEGLRQVEELSQSTMGQLTGGLNIPGL